MTTQLQRIDEILDEYNEHVLNLNILPPEDQLDDEVALHLEDELKSEFWRICDALADPSAGLPITPELSPDADGNLRPDWDMNL